MNFRGKVALVTGGSSGIAPRLIFSLEKAQRWSSLRAAQIPKAAPVFRSGKTRVLKQPLQPAPLRLIPNLRVSNFMCRVAELRGRPRRSWMDNSPREEKPAPYVPRWRKR
jgi:hypothetical protein